MTEHRAKRISLRKKSKFEFEDFKVWLAGLGAPGTPTLHINGPTYSTAVIAVDFGTPLQEFKITPEQNAELVTRMRKAVRDLCGSEVNPRISTDNGNGVWWASLN